MRDDLLDAKAAVDWPVTQIPLLQQRLLSWQRDRAYVLAVEPDSDPTYHVLAAYLQWPFERLVNAEIGAFINSIRSALDLLAATLATRNCVKPSNKTHFPIFSSADRFLGPDGIESKKWLSQSEKAIIKTLMPYKGGDPLLYVLHQLDIRRKHERLITARPRIISFNVSAEGPGLEINYRILENKTILYRLPVTSRFVAEGNNHVAAEVMFNEPTLGLVDEPAFTLLPRFAERVIEIIRLFDS